MHHWEANEKPEYMDIAFSSERSIEDELERETYGDIVTIGKLRVPFHLVLSAVRYVEVGIT
jgi:hypothetical protein